MTAYLLSWSSLPTVHPLGSSSQFPTVLWTHYTLLCLDTSCFIFCFYLKGVLLTLKHTSHLLEAAFCNFSNYRHSWPTLSQHVTQWIGILYILYQPTSRVGGFPGGSVVKNALSTQETQVWSLGQEDPLEKEMETHSSILAWEIPWTEKPDGL